MNAVQLTPGTVFANDFRVVRSLAAGGMGAVYVVEQLSTGKERALKVMLPQLVSDPRNRARFAQEARVAGRIESDHVVEVVAAGVDDATGTPWLAMELLRGQPLDAVLTARGALPRELVYEMLEQLCHALAAAHAVGLVHRDLKPENIFVAEPRRTGAAFTVKVLDFGIAKLVLENRTAATSTAAIGSPLWMAPEQAETRAQIRPSTDVWALGLITFRMLTGRSYWRSANVEEASLSAVMREVLFDPITTASARAIELDVATLVPPGFDGWFARCVERASENRFADAKVAWQALAPILSGDGARPAQPVNALAATMPVTTPSITPRIVVTESPATATPQHVHASATPPSSSPSPGTTQPWQPGTPSAPAPIPVREAAPAAARSSLPMMAALGALAVIAAIAGVSFAWWKMSDRASTRSGDPTVAVSGGASTDLPVIQADDAAAAIAIGPAHVGPIDDAGNEDAGAIAAVEIDAGATETPDAGITEALVYVLIVESTPSGARATVEEQTVETPGRIALTRVPTEPIRVRYVRAGYEPTEQTVEPAAFVLTEGQMRATATATLDRREPVREASNTVNTRPTYTGSGSTRPTTTGSGSTRPTYTGSSGTRPVYTGSGTRPITTGSGVRRVYTGSGVRPVYTGSSGSRPVYTGSTPRRRPGYVPPNPF